MAEQVEHLPLARGERAVDRAHAAAVLGDAAHAFDQAHGELARDDRLAVARALERARQGVEVDALAEEAGGAGAQRHHPDVDAVAGGQHHHAHVGRVLGDLARRLEAVDPRHHKVHNNDVGPVVAGQLNGFAPTPGLGDHHDARFLQDVAQCPARQWIVIDDDDAHGHAIGTRISASVSVVRHATPGILDFAGRNPFGDPVHHVTVRGRRSGVSYLPHGRTSEGGGRSYPADDGADGGAVARPPRSPHTERGARLAVSVRRANQRRRPRGSARVI